MTAQQLKDLETFDVELSVGLVLTLSQSNWRLARKKDRLEKEMGELSLQLLQEEKIDEDDAMFLQSFYPLIAAAVVSGNCPSWEDCINKIPEEDLNLWYAKAREANPKWFTFMDIIRDIGEKEANAEMEIKKEVMLRLNAARPTLMQSST